MVVALGTLHARAEEHLRDVIDELVRRLDVLVPHGRRALRLVADGPDDRADEFVIRPVHRQRLADPFVEHEGAESPALVLLVAALDAQHVGPLVSEQVTVLGRFHKFVDQLVTLVGALVGEELLHLGGRRQRAGDVVIDAAHVLLVAAQFRRDDAEVLPLLRRVDVDEGLGLELPVRDWNGERDGDVEDGDLALVAGHDRRLAAQRQRPRQAGRLDDRDLLVVAVVLGAACDVVDRAVGVVGVDGELGLVLARRHAVLGIDGDVRHNRIVVAAVRRARRDPAANDLVLVGADVDALAAAVGNDARGLEQQ